VVLEIFTLGRFEVRRGSEVISKLDQRSSKRWRLFQLLLTHRGNSISTEELIRHLGLDESVNPPEALKSLVFYLRKDLKGKGNNDYKYILCGQGTYFFNLNARYKLDCEDFEKLCAKGKELVLTNPPEAIKNYQEALNLYRGNYLADQSSALWVVPARNYYRELYLRATMQLILLLREARLFEQAWDVAEKALRVVPLEETIRKSSIESLLDAGKPGLAWVQFEEAVSLYKAHRLGLPPGLLELGKKLTDKNEKNDSPDKLLIELQERRLKSGVFKCDLQTFTALCELERSRSERGNYPVYLVHLMINAQNLIHHQKPVNQILHDLLEKNLRKGDVLCKWDAEHFLLLLVNVDEIMSSQIINRIKERFEKYCGIDSIQLKSSLQKI